MPGAILGTSFLFQHKVANVGMNPHRIRVNLGLGCVFAQETSKGKQT